MVIKILHGFDLCTYLGTCRFQRDAQILPHFDQVGHKDVHHGPRVVGGGSNSQLFLTPWHRRIVDGLDIVTLPLDEFVRQLRAERWVSNLYALPKT